MENVNDLIGNPISLLIERVFWLLMGIFLMVTMITSIIRSQKDNKNREKVITSKDSEKIANKAINKNKMN